eukprot:5331349-Prymnesium_polylepis.1
MGRAGRGPRAGRGGLGVAGRARAAQRIRRARERGAECELACGAALCGGMGAGPGHLFARGSALGPPLVPWARGPPRLPRGAVASRGDGR